MDTFSNVFVTGSRSNNAFKIASDGNIIELINADGKGVNSKDLINPYYMTMDTAGNTYVAGRDSHNVFKITPTGVVTEIIDITGDGVSSLHTPLDIAADNFGNVYVTGYRSHNVFKITPAGVITKIIDVNGDGTYFLSKPLGIAVDSVGNVFVADSDVDSYSNHVFKITPDGDITLIIDIPELRVPHSIAVDSEDNIYVTGFRSNNVFKITPNGVITEIIDASGDGLGNGLSYPNDITVDHVDNIYVAGGFPGNNVFKITPTGFITEIIDGDGDGMGNGLSGPRGIAVDNFGIVYVAGTFGSNNVFKITPTGYITEIIDANGDGLGNGLSNPRGIAVDNFGTAYVAGGDNVFKISPDCNNNNISDYKDITNGSIDCNFNFTLDECDNIESGDFNVDGIVDLNDYLSFNNCLPLDRSECTNACLSAFDFDEDDDIDLLDFSLFQYAFTDERDQDSCECETEFLAYQAVSDIAPAVQIPMGDRWAEDLTLALGEQACEISSLEIGFRAIGTQPYTVDVDLRAFGDTQGLADTTKQFAGEGGDILEIARFSYPPGVFLPSDVFVTFSPSRDGVGIVQVGETQAGSSDNSFRIIVPNSLPLGIDWATEWCINYNGLPTLTCPQLLDSIFHVRINCRGTAPIGACCPRQNVPTTCLGGPLAGVSCTTDGDCMGGQCMIVDTPCPFDAAVPGSQDCQLGSSCLSTCSGGIHDGLTCFTDDDCKSSADPGNIGFCSGVKICDRAVCFDNVALLDCNGRWQELNASGTNRCADNPFDPPCGSHACCLPDDGVLDLRYEQCKRIEDPFSPASVCGQCVISGSSCLIDNDCQTAGDSCIPNDAVCAKGQVCQTNGVCSPRTAVWNAGRFQGENHFSCPIYECNFGSNRCFTEQQEILCGLSPNELECPDGAACRNGICFSGVCENSLCCDRVCQQDSFCCNVIWDSICVEIAEELCPFIPAENDECLCKVCNGVPFRCDVDSDCGRNQDGTQRFCEINNDSCGSQELLFSETGSVGVCLPTSPSCVASGRSSNNLASMSLSDPEFCCNKFAPSEAKNSIWYRFTMPDVSNATSARFQTCGTEDPQATDSIIQVYKATDNTNIEKACGSLITIGCNDDAGGTCGLDGKLSDMCIDGLIPGEQYYISLASATDNVSGIYRLDVEIPCPLASLPPDNNDCAVAEIIDSPTLPYDFDNATISCPTVDQCPSFLSDIWFDYIPDCTGLLTVETCGGGETNLPTAVAVYEVGATDLCPPDPALDFLDCNETPCASVTVPVVGNQLHTLYRIRVGPTAIDVLNDNLIGTLRVTCVSQDCQSNGIPDVTDLADCLPSNPICDDCNQNLIPDICDINDCPMGDVTCADCNFNDIPDVCDISNGEPDTNGDGVPDICTCSQPQPAVWTSIGQHGPSCLFDPSCGGVEYGLDIPADGSFSEPRSTGINKIIIAYDAPIEVSGATVSVSGCDVNGDPQDLSGISMSVVAGANPNEAVLIFSPSLPGNNVQIDETPVKYAITVSGVDCLLIGGSPIVEETRTAWAIFGDANSVRITVNYHDLSYVQAARDVIFSRPTALQTIDPNSSTSVLEIRSDLNNDNTVNNSDIGLVSFARDNVTQPSRYCP